MRRAPLTFAFISRDKTPPASRSLKATVSGTSVELSWTNPASSTYDEIVVSRNLNGTGLQVIMILSPGITTYTDTTPGYASNAYYEVRTRKAGTPSTDVITATVNTIPDVPFISDQVPTNIGQFWITVTGPQHERIDGYDVALSTNGGASYGATADTGLDPNHIFAGIANNSVCRARCRTRGNNGTVSAWVESGTGVVYNDTAGPVIPTITQTWGENNGGFRLSWNNLTDANTVKSHTLFRRYVGGDWTNVGTWNNGNGQNDYFVDVANGKRGENVSFRITAEDNFGNTTTGTTYTFQSKPLGSFYIIPNSSDTWETAGTNDWRTDTNDVVAGFESGYGTQTGYWFYGSQIPDTCKGFAPDTATIILVRSIFSTNSGQNLLAVHNMGTKQAPPSYNNSITATSPGIASAGGAITDTLPQSFRNAMRDGICKGIALVDNGSLQRLAGNNAGVYCGWITLTFN